MLDIDVDCTIVTLTAGVYGPAFVPAITKQIGMATDLPLDIHLMVSDPLKWIDQFAIKNTEFMTVHVEANDVSEAIDKIKTHHIGVGLSIKPHTLVSDLLPVPIVCDVPLSDNL